MENVSIMNITSRVIQSFFEQHLFSELPGPRFCLILEVHLPFRTQLIAPDDIVL